MVQVIFLLVRDANLINLLNATLKLKCRETAQVGQLQKGWCSKMNSPFCSNGSHTRANIMSDIDVMSIPSRNIIIHDPSGVNKHAEYIREMILSHDTDVMLELMSWCLPGDAEPHRLSTTMGSKPTAIANPKQPVTVVYPKSNVQSDLTTDTTMAFKFADVLRSMVYNQGVDNTQPYSYDALFKVNIPDTPTPNFPDYGEEDAKGFRANTPFAPHGPILYLGRIGKTDEHRAFLLNRGQRVQVDYDGITVGRLLTTILVKVVGSKYVAVEAIDLVGTGVSQNAAFSPGSVDESGYYALVMQQSDFQGGTAVMGLTGRVNLDGNGANGSVVTGSVWCQLCTAQFDTVDEIINSYHINGCSLMYTNTSPPAYRLGQTTIFQCPAQSNWLDFLSFDQISNDKDSALIEAVIGAYCFRKPTSLAELSMIAPSRGGTVAGTAEFDFSFELFPDAGPLVIACKIPISSPSGQSGYWTSADVVEFTSLFKWFTTKLELTDDPLLLDRFLIHLSRIPQYHTNDFHFSDIWDGIKDFFGGVWDTVKEIAPVVAPLIPFLLAPSGNPNSPGAGTGKAPRPMQEKVGSVRKISGQLEGKVFGNKDFADVLSSSLSKLKNTPKLSIKSSLVVKPKPHPLPAAPKKAPAKAPPAAAKKKAPVQATKKK